jgi:hypothetical protein
MKIKSPPQLQPPLGVIESRLFAVPDQLLVDIAEDRPVPDALRNAVLADPDAVERLAALRENQPDGTEICDTAPPPLPDFLKDILRRREAASSTSFGKPGEAGQIVCIEEVRSPGDVLDWQLNAPMTALLDAPTDTPHVWHAWLMSPDMDYASWWDVLLEQEDEPFDPMSAMVQVWNPVQVWLPGVDRIVGRLSMARLQALRAVAGEYLLGPDTDPAESRPGRVAPRETEGGLIVLTGSPLAGPDDPRAAYQTLYHAAAEAFRAPAAIAVAEAEQAECQSPLRGWIKGVTDWMQDHLLPSPSPAHWVAQPMAGGAEPTEDAVQLGALLLHVAPGASGGLTLHARLTASGFGRIELTEDGLLLEAHELRQMGAEAVMPLPKPGKGNSSIKIITDGISAEWPLALLDDAT